MSTIYTVKSVSESPAGISLSVTVEGEKPGTARLAELLISLEFWTWGKIAVGEVLSDTVFADMEHAADFSRGVARTRGILSYSAHSRRALAEKLRGYEFSADLSQELADYAVERGYIKENEQACHAADIYLHRKYWGKKRICAELAARGYGEEAIAAAIASIPEGEFQRALCTLIGRKYGTLPADGGERQKMVLSLLRLGYTGQEIKDALASLASSH